MKQEKILKEAKKALTKVYEKYQERGVLSAYLYGSITTNDFNKEKSDIDSIIIVKENFDAKLHENIKETLNKNSPNIKNFFGLCEVYIDELNTGKQKGWLTQYIPPQQILYDLKDSLHVAGKKYLEKDFALKPNLNKIIKEVKEKITSNIEELKTKKRDTRQYIIKTLLRLIYYKEQKKGNIFPFSYNNLKEKTSKENKKLTKELLQIKKEDYPKEKILLLSKKKFFS